MIKKSNKIDRNRNRRTKQFEEKSSNKIYSSKTKPTVQFEQKLFAQIWLTLIVFET